MEPTEVQIARWEKVYWGLAVVAIAILVLEILFDLSWTRWPRAALWSGAGLVGLHLARVLRRAGHDAAAQVLRACFCFFLAFNAVI